MLLLLAHACIPSGTFVRFLGVDLPNHSYVNLTAVGGAQDGSDSVQCHTDLVTCCSAAQGTDRGDWYSPMGSILPFIGYGDVYFLRKAQRVDLRYTGNGGTPGIYQCRTETNAVNNDDNRARESVYVGLYASGGEEATQTAIVFIIM